MFTDGKISDIVIRPIKKYSDERGWLAELFRQDELDEAFFPVMSYVSETNPGVVRGPHEHRDQADYFAFVGPSTFRLYCWDNRKNSPTFGKRMIGEYGAGNPAAIIVPPGVVHAYKNIGPVAGWVFNAPNRLFAGPNKQEPVDEIRHENDPQSPFIIE